MTGPDVANLDAAILHAAVTDAIRAAAALADIVAAVDTVSASAQGRRGIVHAGTVGQVRETGEAVPAAPVATDLATMHQLSVLDHTERGRLLADVTVHAAILRSALRLLHASGLDVATAARQTHDFLYGDPTVPENSPLSLANCLRGRAMRAFIASLAGDLVVVSENARPDRMLARVAVPEALRNPNIVSIGGVPRETLLEPPVPAPAEPKPEFPGARRNDDGTSTLDNGVPDPVATSHLVARYLLDQYRSERTGRFETVLSAIGALAGFSAQEALWRGVIGPGTMTADQVFTTCVETTNAVTCRSGDFLDQILVSRHQRELSIWRFVAGAAVENGVTPCPTWSAAGEPAELPRNALRHWRSVKALLEASKPPLHWPLELAVATNPLIRAAGTTLPPDRAALIVMEAAIPMSRLDPLTAPGGVRIDD